MNAPVDIDLSKPMFGEIPLACVIPSKTNPRKNFDQASLDELAESIKQHGVAQPILVRPLPNTDEHQDCVEIVAGERRYRASMLAGLQTIPAIVRELSDVQALELQIIENLQRKDVHEIEEAEGYDRLMKEHGYTADQLAEKVGKSRSYIYGRLKFCGLCESARAAFYDGKLTASTALLIARIPGQHLQEQATDELTSGDDPLSYREAVNFVQQRFMLDLTSAPFSLSDIKLVAAAGSCDACPKRTGNSPLLFPDVKRTHVCTDPDCFAVKRIAHGQKAITQAKKKGIPVYTPEQAEDLDTGKFSSPSSQIWDFERRKDGVGWKKIEEVLPVDARPKPVAFIEHGDGKVEELYDRTAMQLALEKAGLCETAEARTERLERAHATTSGTEAGSGEATAEEAERAARVEQRRKQAEAETKVRIAAYERVRAHMAAGLTTEAWRVVALELAFNYPAPNKELPSVYQWEGHSHEKLREFVQAASHEQLQLLVMDMVVASALSITPYQLNAEGKPDLDEDEYYPSLAALAEGAGVDIESIRADLLPPVEELPAPAPARKTTKGGKKGKTAAKPAEAEAEPTSTSTAEEDPAHVAWPFPTGGRP